MNQESAPPPSSPSWNWAAAVLLLFVAGLAFMLWRSSQELPPAPELKYVALVNDDAGIWRDQGQNGSWLVVNFWATWCAPCLAELPILEAFSQAHDPAEARVIGYTRLYQTEPGNDPTQEVRYITSFLAQQNVTFPSLVNDSGQVHFAYGVENLPTTILINPQGQIADIGVGIVETTQILDRVEAILREQ